MKRFIVSVLSLMFGGSMQAQTIQTQLDEIVLGTANHKLIEGVTVQLVKDGVTYHSSEGNLSHEDKYFIASTTKLYTTAVVMKLRELERLELDHPISKYLDASLLKGLHVYKGVDYSQEITIKQLLAHTSGLPDYFEGKKANGKSLLDELTQDGKDAQWSYQEVIELSKTMSPLFAPGTPGKAHYSDTNYQLLGMIIEIVSGKSIEENYKTFIYEPLNLTKTYLYTNEKDFKPKPLRYESDSLMIPKAMTSFRSDGGIVSTSEEVYRFLKAFFDGHIFPKVYLEEMKDFNKIFFPLEYGVGMSKFTMPKVFNGFKEFPELIGHSGLSGAFAFYCPSKEMYITGTVNQISHPEISFKMMAKIIRLIE